MQRFPLRSENSGNLAYIDVVLVPGTESDPKVTLFNPDDPAQVDLQRHAFLVDTGADHSLVKPDKACLLARQGLFPGYTAPVSQEGLRCLSSAQATSTSSFRGFCAVRPASGADA